MMLVPDSIDSTGGTDVTRDLNHLFETTPDRTTITFPNGRFRLDGTLLLPNRALTLEGSGNSTLFGFGDGTTDPFSPRIHPGRNRSQLRVIGGTSAVRNLAIKGANPNGGLDDDAYVAALEAQHNIELAGVRSFTIDSCHLTDPYGDMIYFASAPGINQCIRVADTVMARSGRMAVTLNGFRGILMERCNISQIRRSVFDHEPTTRSTVAVGVTIRECVFGGHRLNFIAAAGGVAGVYCTDWRVQDNVSTSPFTTLFYGSNLARRRNFEFTGNKTTGDGYGTPSGGLLAFKHTDGVHIADNVTPLQQGRTPAMQIAIYDDCSATNEQGNETAP